MKNKKGLVLCLCMAMLLSGFTATAVGCKKEGNKQDSSVSAPTEYNEDGEYYFDAADGEYSVSLEDNAFSLSIDGDDKSGVYTYDGTTLTLTFSDQTKATGTLKDGVLTLTYKGATYRFLEKVNYTVSYSVDGAVSSSAIVVNGRKATKPQDPAKEGYTFVGWYADSAFKKAYAFDATPVTADVTLYARFVATVEGADEFTVKFVVDGEQTTNVVTTVGGIAFGLPTPAKEGATFAGWWLSDYEDEDKLTCKYEEQQLKQNTTLYAVWESDAPAVSVNEKGVSWTAKANSYSLKITAPDGTEVKTSQGTATYDYDFASKAAGDYVVEVMANGKTTKAYYKNKALAKVSLFSVEGSVLVFNAVENAEKYLITVDCGYDDHEHTDVDNGTSTTYNFENCAMQEGGIKFTVKAVADGYIASQSETFAFSRALESVANLRVNAVTEEVVWNAVDNATSYVLEIKNGANTETVTVNGTSYSIKAYTGDLSFKVTPVAHGYNSPEATTLAYTKNSLAVPANIYLDQATVRWDKVDGAAKYVVKINEKSYETKENALTLIKNAHYMENWESCEISVSALAANAANNSVFSDTVTVRFGTMAEDSLVYANGELSWAPVINVQKYEVKVNGGEAVALAATAVKAPVTLTKAGVNTLSVRCFNSKGTASEWVDLDVTAYEVTFDVSGGVAVDTVYKAKGETVALPVTEAIGYDFKGWYNAPNGTNATKYNTVTVEKDMVLYAHWNAKEYKITLVAGEEGELDITEYTVRYKQSFKLPTIIATYEASQIFFGGWYTEANGKGFQYADIDGNSLDVWKDTKDMTLYADWLHVLAYTEVTGEYGKGYAVTQGEDIDYVTSVKIPVEHNGLPVIQIGADAFAFCTNLTKLEIPDTIQDIVGLAASGGNGTGSPFRSCNNLKEIYVYEVRGQHEVFYEDVDGILLYNNSVTGEKEIKFFPQSITGSYRIPNGVTTIPLNTFYRSQLSEIIIPASVTNINTTAFYDADMLTSVVFEAPADGETAKPLVVGDYAFQSCSSLVEITFPARLSSVSSTVFESCGLFVAINVEEGGTTYSSKDGVLCNAAGTEIIYCPVKRAGSFTVPAGVSSIGENAFKECKLLTEIIIPGYVTNIAKSAFEGCTLVKSVIFQGAKNDPRINIGESAFYGCTSLSELALPLNLKQLSAYAFGGISNLKKVEVDVGADVKLANAAFGSRPTTSSPTSSYYVTELHIGADVPVFDITGVFGGQKLTDVYVSEDNNNYSRKDGVLFNKAETEIVYYPTERMDDYVIPETVTSIGAGVFRGKFIQKITIGKNVASIGNEAFADCAFLKEIVFEESDTPLTIGDVAFYKCSRLETLELPDRLTSIGANAFEDCTSLAIDLVIPEKVTSIGVNAFRQSAIKSIAIPASITSLEGSSVSISGATGSFDQFDMFEECASLTAINVAENNENYLSIDGVLYKKNANGEASELLYCPVWKMGKVTVPGTVTKVWAYAFYNTRGVNEVEFLPTEGDAVLELSAQSFYMVSLQYNKLDVLEKITLPEGVKTIPVLAFNYCGALKEITIPNTVTLIEKSAFANCASLQKVYFEEGNESAPLDLGGTNTSTSAGVFYGCAALKEVNLPERTSIIGTATFSGCKALEEIVIPASVVTIKNVAFNNCSNLKKVTFAEGSKLTTIQLNAFGNTAIESIAIPAGVTTMAAAFKNCEQLKSFTFPSNLTSVANSTFYGCISLEKVIFPENSKIKTIDYLSFVGCMSLKEIDIPATVEEIKHSAFRYCTSLEKVNFLVDSTTGKSNLKKIYHWSFQETALKEFILPESNNSITIEYDTFLYCRDLEKVYISSTVESINRVFEQCASIKEIIISKDNENLVVDENAPIVYNKDKTAIQYIYGDIETDTYVIPEGVTQIGNYAFSGQTSLKKVVIPSTIKSIGVNAFINCVNLETVEFAEGVTQLTKLDNYTFQNCKSLKNINIPTSVKTFGTYVFDGCESLTNIELHDGVTALGDYMFRESGLTSFTVPTGVKVLPQYLFALCADLKEVKLHEKVTTINGYVFRGCESLTSIDLPDSITTLAQYAFAGAYFDEVTVPGNVQVNNYLFSDTSTTSYTYVKKIILSEGITQIGRYAFRNCIELTEVVLPNSLVKICDYAFDNCTLLKEVTIPEGVTMLGSNTTSFTISTNAYTFRNCTSLEKVVLPSKLTQIGGYAFQNCTALTSINLENVTMLAGYAFENAGIKSADLSSLQQVNINVFKACTQLETVKLGNTLATMNNGMFWGCSALKEVKIPDSVTAINGNVFRECTSLETLVIPQNAVLNKASYVFQGCTNLRSLTISSPLTEIAMNMFDGCEKLTSFTIPDTVKTIANYAFQGTSIERLHLPKLITSLSNYSLAGCDTLKEITVDSANTVFTSVDGVLYNSDNEIQCYPAGKELENGVLVIPEEVGIYKYAFAGVKTVKEVYLPSSMVVVPAYAFYGCESIEKVVIAEGATQIGNYAFQNCTSLKEIVIPDTVTSIGSSAFNGTSSLKTIDLPENLETLSSGLFTNAGIESITIPANITTLPSALFSGCYALKTVVLPETLTEIATNTFMNSGLVSIEIPETVTKIGEGAFRGSALKSIVIPDTVTTMANNVFHSCADLETVVLPKHLESLYQWFFRYCTSLKNVTLPEDLKDIGRYTFEGCTSLESIVIPAGVTAIGSNPLDSISTWSWTLATGSTGFVFADCINLKNVTILGDVTHIGTSAFANCTSLESITLPESLAIISQKAFAGCSNLKNVNIPENVLFIAPSAFANCTSIKSIVIPERTMLWKPSGIAEVSAFAGWTADQTINFCASQYTVTKFAHYYQSTGANIAVDFMKDCAATIVYDYKA